MIRRTQLLLLVTLLAAGACLAAGPKLETEDQKTIYALGLTIAGNLKTFGLTEEEVPLLVAGLEDGLLGRETAVNPGEYQPKIQNMARARAEATAEREKKASQEFLEKAAAKKGAEKLDSGAVFLPLSPGSGEQPAASDRVKVHYTGTLRDGTVFDSSVERGEPASFPLSGVIACWTETVQKMKVGGKYKIWCPSDIAYGDRGRPPTIPPGATLAFEIELLEILK
jgi:FKBP-type peptidyl-prolyl cis-trans isomerase